MGVFGKFFRKRKADQKENDAIGYETEHKYDEAAKAWAERASSELNDNELIFADDCLDSCKDWIKAGNIEEALNQARRALQGFMLDDWLKDDEDGEYLNELTDTVALMKKAGHNKEADLFLTDINNALRSIDVKPVSLVVMSDENRFPADCPHCGAAISYMGNLDAINCPFCGGVIHSI
jgi:hypothetical protein